MHEDVHRTQVVPAWRTTLVWRSRAHDHPRGPWAALFVRFNFLNFGDEHFIPAIVRESQRNFQYHFTNELRDEDRYIFKQQATSLHQHVLRYPLRPGMSVIELGAGQGHISRAFHKRGAEVLAMDLVRPPQPFPFPFLEHDLEGGFADAVLKKHGPVDLVIMLDVIEHLAEPERAILDVWRILHAQRDLPAWMAATPP